MEYRIEAHQRTRLINTFLTTFIYHVSLVCSAYVPQMQQPQLQQQQQQKQQQQQPQEQLQLQQQLQQQLQNQQFQQNQRTNAL